MQKNSLRATTLQSYTEIIERHIIPEIGNIKITQLRGDHLNHLYSKKLSSNLSNRTVEYIHGILRRSLNKAVKWGLLARNPTDMASPPSVKFKQPSVWSSEQVKTFLEHVKDDRWGAIFYLACGTGMRKGEILGLPLTAINLTDGYLKILQTLQFVPTKGLLIMDPKTDKSRRMIVLPDFVLASIKAHLKRREEISKSSRWRESGLVFTTDVGTPISPRNLMRHFKAKLKEAGVPDNPFP